jgi:hypothetical protein
MTRLALAAVLLTALTAAGPARADVGVRLSTTTVSIGQLLRGTGAGGMPLYLVPEHSAPRSYSCRGGRAVCVPKVERPRAPYVFLGTVRRSGGAFACRVGNVAPGWYQVVLWYRSCGVNLILAPVWQQGVKRAQLVDGLMHVPRAQLLRLGVRRWAGQKGSLELAPPYLRGGMLGNHLIFRWHARRREHLMSLHAWEPLTEAVGVLRAIVVGTRARG